MPAERPPNSPRGRGSAVQPPNRFERLSIILDEEVAAGEPGPRTQFLRDSAQSIISYNNSPDIPWTASINAYRGCEHGCAYCYARPYHEYLGFSSGLDFESRIMVKMEAPSLLRAELSRPKWQPQVLAMSGVTDCYQPVERKLELTRGCLEVLAEFRNPVGIITKNHLVTRDRDHLSELAKFQAARVYISITTLDPDLASRLEPRASRPAHRLAAIKELSDAGIPAGVLVAPIIPGLNEHEIPAILDAAAGAGAQFASYTILRLPYAVKDIFRSWLETHFPDRVDRVLNRVRDLRGGKLNVSTFGERFRGSGLLADEISNLFTVTARRAGIDRKSPPLCTDAFRRPAAAQMELF
ncbi:MAG TPA: PA0069 family radical SAM protein [Chthoniobacterales bacterium]|nr:PA0069 family radical SAM protein [Chthoniobacterales bacterium]